MGPVATMAAPILRVEKLAVACFPVMELETANPGDQGLQKRALRSVRAGRWCRSGLDEEGGKRNRRADSSSSPTWEPRGHTEAVKFDLMEPLRPDGA